MLKQIAAVICLACAAPAWAQTQNAPQEPALSAEDYAARLQQIGAGQTAEKPAPVTLGQMTGGTVVPRPAQSVPFLGAEGWQKKIEAEKARDHQDAEPGK